MVEARAELRVAVRHVARTPGFSTAAILIIGLGVGLATAVFTVADAILIRRLPVADQDRIVVLQGETPDHQTDNVPLDAEHARDYARSTTTLARIAFFLYNGAAPVTVRDGERISSMQEALVSGDYFDVLGTRPLVGAPYAAATTGSARRASPSSAIGPGRNAMAERPT
jgi:hypothetical protein